MLEWLFGKKKQQPKPEAVEQQQQKKKKKTQSQQQSQDIIQKWQYQFLVQFLNSPLWRVSILDFVDENCVVFDSQEENKFQYTKIHNKFKELVGTLFDGMMQEIGLDEDKLIELLEKGFQSKQKKLFNQLLLCDDFLKCKELMVKRNKTLENQALGAINGQQRKKSVLDKQRNLVHSSLKQQQARQKKLEQEQQQILRKVLEMSKIQAEQRHQIQKLVEQAENDQYHKKLKQSKLNEEKEKQESRLRQKLAKEKQEADLRDQQSRKQMEEIKKNYQQKMNKQKPQKSKPLESLPPLSQPHKQSNVSDLPPLKQPVVKTTIQPTITKQQEQQPHSQVKQQSKTESSQQRKRRLLEQREKIRKKKQQQRKKMLEEQSTDTKKTMNIVLQDQGIHESSHPTNEQEHQHDQKISKDEIERRKQIMKKIKNRIVDDF